MNFNKYNSVNLIVDKHFVDSVFRVYI